MTSSVPRALFRYSFAVKQEAVVRGDGFKKHKLSIRTSEFRQHRVPRAESETAYVLENCIAFGFIVFFFFCFL